MGAPVIDDANHVVGFVSEHDCLRDLLNDAFFGENSPAVSAVMNRQVMVVAPDTSIVEIAEKMAEQSYQYLPVVHRGKLVRLISRSRIVRALVETSEEWCLHQ